MEVIITDQDRYKFVLEKKAVLNPSELTQITLRKEIYNEDGEIEWASKFEMFLDADQIKLIKEAL